MSTQQILTKLSVKGKIISIYSHNKEDFICITDIARYKDPERTDQIIQNWIRNRNTVEFLGIWEKINNSNFNPLDFEGFRRQAGLNSFTLTAKQWIEQTNAVGLISKSGRYGGGTFAHKDIAFEFAAWVSVEFKLYLIKEFQRLKEDENKRLKLDWNLQRTLAKVNYRIHTDAIKERLIPSELTDQQIQMVYANEADILNMALFGVTARQWRDANSSKKGNIRDYAAIEQLIVLSNLESINSVLIHQGLKQSQRLKQLNGIAITQMRSLIGNRNIRGLYAK